jgi:hypothetical protein
VKTLFTTLFIFFGICFSANAQSVVIYADVESSDTLKKMVSILSTELKKSQRITIANASADSYAGNGIYISCVTKEKQKLAPNAVLRKAGIEAYSINADGKSVQILGNSDMAVGHGIFAWLESLGYRYYFANPDWYIVPVKLDVYARLSVTSKPAFDHRKIWYGYGTGSEKANNDYFFWMLANKQGGTMNAYFGHSYGNIIARNRDAFLQHPEWFYPEAPKGTAPPDGKFDMSNEGLVQLVIKDAENQIEASLKNKTQAYKMVSVAPSDGNGTCNTPACQQLGTVTDRVYYLVNRVAKAIQKKYPSTLVGCLAYSEYSEPPTVKVQPNVFVCVTTAFNTTNYTTAQLIDKWRQKGAVVGLYDYFSWYAWDFDLPGQSQVGKITEMAKTIRKYYSQGVKAYDAESSIGWVSKGLGYYIAAKLMWDVNTDVNKTKQEFFDLCFLKAVGPMKQMWNEWENYSFTTLRESDLAKWIDLVISAEKLETDVTVQRRLFQVKSYLHYLALYRQYELNKSEANLLALLNYGYRKLDDGSVSGYPAFFALGGQSGIAGMGFTEDAKWRKGNTPVTVPEINNLIREDRSKLVIAKPVKAFVATVKFKTVSNIGRYPKVMMDSSNSNNAFWMQQEFVMEIKKKGTANYIELTGDYIANAGNKKPIKLAVYPYTKDGVFSGKSPLLTYDYNSKQVKERISLSALAPGFYSVFVDDPVKIFKINFSDPVNYSIVARPARHIMSRTLDYAFIYVPENVSFFNVIKSNVVEFITPAGRHIKFDSNKPEDLQVEVKKGESGLWRIKYLYERLYLEGIPPYIGLSPKQMLIPADLN